VIASFHPRVAILNTRGDHVRYVPAALARAMVVGGAAALVPGGGRVRAVSLARTAEACAQRIGEPTGRATGVPFCRLGAPGSIRLARLSSTTRAVCFTFYNFCRVHKSLRVTHAMAAGIAGRIWACVISWRLRERIANRP
jgi:hypothetical protein